ncbi:MAG TPA: tetratricopeptide repeat protein [Pyrinomonadaceae bacterium]
MKTTDVRSRCSLRRTLFAAIFAVSLAVLPTGARTQQPGVPDVSSRLTELTQRLSVKPVDGGAVEESRAFGVELLGAARFEEAARLFAAFRLAAPDDPAGFYGGALALFNLRRLDDAQTLARAAIEKGLAPARLRQPTTVNSTTAATKTFGSAPDSLVLLGVVLAVKGDDAGALAAVSRAVSLAPDNFDAQFALGRARYGANDPAGAARAFAAASALKPRDEQTRFFLASALESAGDDAGALAAYRELVTLAPGLAEGHLGVGVLLVKRAGDDLSEGIRELEKALAIKEGLYEGQVALGRALIRKGRIAEAIKPLQHAAQLAPNNPEPHYQLAIAYRRLGNKDSADAESALVKKINAARRSSPVARSDESAPVKRP